MSITQTLESLEGLHRVVTLTIPEAYLKKEIEQRLKQSATKANVPGFRRGKVPLSVMQRLYGEQERKEIEETIIKSEVQKTKLRVLSGLRWTYENTTADGAPVEQYKIFFEIAPDFTLPPVEELEIEKWSISVAPEDIERTLDNIRRQQQTYELASRPTAKDDQIIFSYTLSVDNITIYEETSVPGLVTGETGPIMVRADHPIPDLPADKVIGLSAEGKYEYEYEYPENFHDERLAGQKASVSIRIQSVLAPKLPEVNEEFAQKMGAESIQELKESIAKHLEEYAQGKAGTKNAANALDALHRKIEIMIPDCLQQAAYADRMREMLQSTTRVAPNALAQLSVEQMEQWIKVVSPEHAKTVTEKLQTQSRQRVARRLILEKLREQYSEQTIPTREELHQAIAKNAQQYQDPKHALGEMLGDPEAMRGAFDQVSLDKTIALVMKLAKVTEKSLTLAEVEKQTAEATGMNTDDTASSI